jgi:hypothetical protein
LQWHFRVNGADRPPPEPILRDIRTIENRDALIEYDERVLERDENGAPVTRWDGETMKVHSVTGKAVPDETARVEVYRYINPRAAAWPKADFIVGNPPFIGSKRMRSVLGDEYVDALQAAIPAIPDATDLVLRWWHLAANLVARKSVRAMGLVGSNSIQQAYNRRIIEQHLADGEVSLAYVVADHPWTDEKDGAAVRISMSVLVAGKSTGRLIDQVTDEDISLPEAKRGIIHADFRAGADVSSVGPLRANGALCCVGMKTIGSGFIVSAEEANVLIAADREEADTRIHPYLNGRDIADRPRGVFVIDLFGLSESDVRSKLPGVYQHLFNSVRPERAQNRNDAFRREWWLLGHPRPLFREFTAQLKRYVATLETAKHRFFTFLPRETLPDSALVTFGFDDAYHLGVLSSRIHIVWSLAAGGRLGVGNDPRYNKSRCFDPFPFPGEVPEALRASIRAEAEALDALRKRVLAEHSDLTLTKLYNVLEALGEGRALTSAERDIHDRGLVTLMRQHHDAIDEGVADAYGWGEEHRAGTLDEEAILTRLVALNKERAAEEARGLVRYLRPEFQDPGYRAPVTATLDLGEAPSAPVSNVIPWPATLPEQVGAVQSILAAAPVPLDAQDIARSFKGKRAATVRPVLDALARLGMARRLNDGRFAA